MFTLLWFVLTLKSGNLSLRSLKVMVNKARGQMVCQLRKDFFKKKINKNTYEDQGEEKARMGSEIQER